MLQFGLRKCKCECKTGFERDELGHHYVLFNGRRDCRKQQTGNAAEFMLKDAVMLSVLRTMGDLCEKDT